MLSKSEVKVAIYPYKFAWSDEKLARERASCWGIDGTFAVMNVF